MPPPGRHGPPHVKRPRLGDRTMLACIFCKQKKLKCDGQSPRCHHCARSGQDCLVEDPATGLHRPRNYMQALEARVAYLEGIVQKVRPEVASDHLVSGGANGDESRPIPDVQLEPMMPGVESSTPLTSNSHVAPEDIQSTQSTDADDPADHLSADVALLCLNAADREPHYFGPSSAVSFSRIVSAAMNLPKKPGSSQHLADVNKWTSTQPFPVVFPSPALGSTLSRAYFDNLHPQYPFLHRPTFLAWENICMESDAAGNLYAAGDVPLFFVWMVYAIASLALGPSHYEIAESYYYQALNHQAAILELDSLESIQSLLCCALYSVRSPEGGSLWRISGLAIRHCVELGYHRSVGRYRKNANPLIAEMSKRCFWVAYDIDRVASFILGRPVGIPDDCIDAEMPLDINDEDINRTGLTPNPNETGSKHPTNMTGALHVIKLRRLWSKIGNNIYPTISNSSMIGESARKPLIDQLAAELEEWHNDIPLLPEAGSSDALSVFASREWFRLAYDHSVLLLYRHWITHVPVPGEEECVEAAIETCTHRAREICVLYRRLFQSQSIQFTWGSLHILFLAGLTFLYCVWKSLRARRSLKRTDIINTCMACNTALVIIAERWSKATAYQELFEILSEKTIYLVCGDEQPTQAEAAGGSLEHEILESRPQPLEDWISGIDNQDVPMDSEWLVQELLQGMQETGPGIASDSYNGQFQMPF